MALLARSPELTMRMRSILVAWMLEVSLSYKLSFSTFMAATEYLDRYLSINTSDRKQFQLVGATALLVASKMVEIYSPDVKDFVYLCDNAYTADDMLNMERALVTALGFALATRATHYTDTAMQLAEALYVIHHPSLIMGAADVRRTIRGIRYVLTTGRIMRCKPRRKREREDAGTFIKQLGDPKLMAGSRVCVKFGVKFADFESS